jgi:hypothetical protein
MTKEEKIEILRSTIDVKADIGLALNKLEFTTGIEIGVRKGGNTKQICLANPFFARGKFVALDCWQEVADEPTFNDKAYATGELDRQYESVVKMFEPYPYIDVVRDFSVEGSERFEDEYFDFCYIDAAHDYRNVMKDLETWWPKIKSGGVLAGHDWFPDKRVWRNVPVGVYEAVADFCKEVGTEVHHSTDCSKEGGKGRCCPSFFIVKD